MNFSYLNLLSKFAVFTSADSTSKLTNSYQDVDVLLSNLSLSGYVIPIESGIIGIFAFMLIFFLTEYNTRLLSYEKFKLVINILQKMHTPLLLLRNQLEDIASDGLPETAARKMQQILKHTEHIIDCNQNTMVLDRVDWTNTHQTAITEFELQTYITSIINQCRPFASSRQIQLKMHEGTGYTACKVNETVMTAILQHLLNKMIEITPPNGCINISTSGTANAWKLQISNCKENETCKRIPFIPIMFPIHGYSDLWTVRKIIRLHGGKIIGYTRRKTIIIQIIVPANCQCNMKTRPEYSAKDNGKTPRTENHPCILLIMADKQFSNYLKTALSKEFQTLVIESPDQAVSASIRQNPDAIIIDETVNGIYGDKLCSQIKANKAISNIPVMLLVKANDNTSYLSHAESRADRLELRTTNICRLKMDIHMLIKRHVTLRKQIEQFLADTISAVKPSTSENKDNNASFINRVKKLLEKNLETEGYTIDMLSADIGMSRSSLYSKIKDITGKSPNDYMFTFKMETARILLASRQYSISEIASMLGYCDAKYFGKRFKEYYHVCPTEYIQSIIG